MLAMRIAALDEGVGRDPGLPDTSGGGGMRGPPIQESSGFPPRLSIQLFRPLAGRVCGPVYT